MTEIVENENKKRLGSNPFLTGVAATAAVGALGLAVFSFRPVHNIIVDTVNDALLNVGASKDKSLAYTLTPLNGSFKLSKIKPRLASRYAALEVRCDRSLGSNSSVSLLAMRYVKETDFRLTYFTIVSVPNLGMAYQKVAVKDSSEIIGYSSASQRSNPTATPSRADPIFDFKPMSYQDGQIQGDTKGFDDHIRPAFATAQALCGTPTPYQTARRVGAVLTRSPSRLGSDIAANSRFLQQQDVKSAIPLRLIYDARTGLIGPYTLPVNPAP